MRCMALRTKYRTYLKRARSAAEAGNESAQEAFAEFARIADGVSGKGVIPPNRTARLKSRLAALLKRSGAKAYVAAAAAQPAAEAQPAEEAAPASAGEGQAPAPAAAG